MNYRHAFHAGNFADVLKHATLARILMHLGEKPAPFRVLDTHAGAGLYDLAGAEAERTGEWRLGIGRLIDVVLAPDLRRLLAAQEGVREDERRRIARELHDELGQRLTALKIDLAGLVAAAKVAPNDERVAGMQAMLDDTLASVRRIATDLRPLMLDDLGPAAAIEWLARDASQRMGIPVHARLPVTELAVDQRVSIALYRMVQEALTNVARHAHARSVEVELRIDGDRLVLTVGDDGTGLAPDALERSGSFGLMGLRERAHMLGGEFRIVARRGGGTRLVATLPLSAPASGEMRS